MASCVYSTISLHLEHSSLKFTPEIELLNSHGMHMVKVNINFLLKSHFYVVLWPRKKSRPVCPNQFLLLYILYSKINFVSHFLECSRSTLQILIISLHYFILQLSFFWNILKWPRPHFRKLKTNWPKNRHDYVVRISASCWSII